MDSEELTGMVVYPRSVTEWEGVTYALARGPAGKVLLVRGDATGFEGETHGDATLCPLTGVNAAVLRNRLPWLHPQPLGLATSAGCGDRLGLATPGHIRAIRDVDGIVPVFAQQSMRENARTGRSPQDVVDDAQWGLLQEGWTEPWGADADHLKTTDDVALCVSAGYTFYTIDPGDHVDNAAHSASLEVLESEIHNLPWRELEDTPEALQARYLERSFAVEGIALEFDQATLARAVAKYGRAIAHTVSLYRHLDSLTDRYEFEMSVDETDTPTLAEEHFFIASELKRLGVQWASLAPRYVGRFEKGVDYIGDLGEFECELAKHAAIARAVGPYKLSIHSGSDKFSIYPLLARHTRGLVHLKTAGTSYLEAVRAVAQVDPAFFREILACAMEHYPIDRATYHVSADLVRVPPPASLADAELPALLDQFDAREVLHVTFGSVLDRFHDRLLRTLDEHEEAHYSALQAHFDRHLRPLVE